MYQCSVKILCRDKIGILIVALKVPEFTLQSVGKGQDDTGIPLTLLTNTVSGNQDMPVLDLTTVPLLGYGYITILSAYLQCLMILNDEAN